MTPESTGTYNDPKPAREPTSGDIMVIGQTAGEAVNPETQTPTEARAAVQDSVQEKARELQIKLHPDAISAIADGTIAELERRGAFHKDDSGDGDGEGNAKSGDPSATVASSEAMSPPRKKTLAEKFLGNR